MLLACFVGFVGIALLMKPSFALAPRDHAVFLAMSSALECEQIVAFLLSKRTRRREDGTDKYGDADCTTLHGISIRGNLAALTRSTRDDGRLFAAGLSPIIGRLGGSCRRFDRTPPCIP